MHTFAMFLFLNWTTLCKHDNLLNLRDNLVDSLAKLSLAKANVFVSSVTIALIQMQFSNQDDPLLKPWW